MNNTAWDYENIPHLNRSSYPLLLSVDEVSENDIKGQEKSGNISSFVVDDPSSKESYS